MASKIEYKDLLDAGVHFGHLTRKWDPRMAPYIFMERNGIHIIDLNKTLACLEEAVDAVKKLVRDNRRIMFVATKKQAKDFVAEEARRLRMPFVTERWLGGMLTNFQTVRKSLKRMQTLDKMFKDPAIISTFTKKEQLMMTRERDKLERVLGGITDLNRLPAALFIVDVKREHIAVSEAHRLGIPVIGLVDTNSNPYECEFPIPANDDAFKSIALITKVIGQAIEEAFAERKKDKEDEDALGLETELAEGFAAASEAPANDELTQFTAAAATGEEEATEVNTSENTRVSGDLLAAAEEDAPETVPAISGDADQTTEKEADKAGDGESYA